MANVSVEANILSALPPGTVSAEWVDLSDQLGDEFTADKSRIVKAVTTKSEVVYYLGHMATTPQIPFFVEVHLPKGTTATEPGSSSDLRSDLVDALNQLPRQ